MRRRCGFAAVLIAAMLLGACGGDGDKGKESDTKKQEQAKKVDIQSLGEEMVEKISFTKELKQVDKDVVENYITLEDGVTAVMWMTDGSTAEELAVFEAPDDDTGDQQMANAQMYLDDQRTSFEDYIPEEAKRIDDAVIKRTGKYVVLCVSENSNEAADIIDKVLN